IYSLSLAVYATAWTFYGSVGRAASTGVGFLPIYIGPTLVALLWWSVLRKMIRIGKVHRITSLADFIASRYGKSAPLAGLVTLIAVVGILPYISLQLKAIATGLDVLRTHHVAAAGLPPGEGAPLFADSAFSIAMLLAAFTIVFGTRHLDASERHEGMVAAIAFESLVKLVSFLAVGAFVTWGIYDGFGDVFARARAVPGLERLFVIGDGGAAGIGPAWSSLVSSSFVAMLAILLLPRQFQVAVVENVDERHLKTAIWLFPLYLLVINVFVPAIAFGGLVRFAGAGVDPDTFVLSLPLAEGQNALALLVFLGGLSASTGMVIVETIALSTMVCNDLVMPLLLRWPALRLHEREDLSGLLLGIRRGAIVVTLVLGYLYFRLAGEAYALVSIGLFSFAAVAQFAPALLGGIFWRAGTRLGAFAGLGAGFAVWLYTLVLPLFARSGVLPAAILTEGPFGAGWLRPTALLGVAGLDEITHAVLWSMIANVGAYVGVSLATGQSAVERSQATLFVDVFRHSGAGTGSLFWRGGVSVQELRGLLSRFLGPDKAGDVLESYARQRHLKTAFEVEADANLVQFAETQLAGAIGGASAHAMVASVVKEAPLTMDEVMSILEEASQIMKYSRELEQKSRELEAAYADLRAANEQLRELDRLKDDFVSHVSHELRTPLTSIRAFSEILHDNPALDPQQRTRYLAVVIAESERLTRLINDILDLAKIEAGGLEWHLGPLDPREVVEHAASTTRQLFEDRQVTLEVRLPASVPPVVADRDRLVQVLLNLLSNAAKYGSERGGRVVVSLHALHDSVRVDVQDDGPGIAQADQERIFQKFRQSGDTAADRPRGTGLGLAISREIIQRFGGRLWVESTPGRGSTFSFTVPAFAAAPASPARSA
ncbi:MAG TPA: ATP-binding protein, partial [Anaeromyxobacteraceae bacterium]|nr:ATP-binding protein [Anaeromyxobacteraceae bacterium]